MACFPLGPFILLPKSSTQLFTLTINRSFILQGLWSMKPWEYWFLFLRERPPAFWNSRMRVKTLWKMEALEWTQYKLLYWRTHHAWADIQPAHNSSHIGGGKKLNTYLSSGKGPPEILERLPITQKTSPPLHGPAAWRVGSRTRPCSRSTVASVPRAGIWRWWMGEYC